MVKLVKVIFKEDATDDYIKKQTETITEVIDRCNRIKVDKPLYIIKVKVDPNCNKKPNATTIRFFTHRILHAIEGDNKCEYLIVPIGDRIEDIEIERV